MKNNKFELFDYVKVVNPYLYGCVGTITCVHDSCSGGSTMYSIEADGDYDLEDDLFEENELELCAVPR